jgi:hypothetical protein
MTMKKTVDIPANATMMVISAYFLSFAAIVSLLSTLSSATRFVMSLASSIIMQEQVDKSNVKPEIVNHNILGFSEIVQISQGP